MAVFQNNLISHVRGNSSSSLHISVIILFLLIFHVSHNLHPVWAGDFIAIDTPLFKMSLSPFPPKLIPPHPVEEDFRLPCSEPTTTGALLSEFNLPSLGTTVSEEAEGLLSKEKEEQEEEEAANEVDKYFDKSGADGDEEMKKVLFMVMIFLFFASITFILLSYNFLSRNLMRNPLGF